MMLTKEEKARIRACKHPGLIAGSCDAKVCPYCGRRTVDGEESYPCAGFISDGLCDKSCRAYKINKTLWYQAN